MGKHPRISKNVILAVSPEDRQVNFEPCKQVPALEKILHPHPQRRSIPTVLSNAKFKAHGYPSEIRNYFLLAIWNKQN